MVASNDMTQGNIPKQMIRFSIPILLGSTLDIFYTMSDSMILGRLAGLPAFAAVGATGFFLWMIFCLTSGLSIGFSSVFGQKFGAGDADGLSRSIATAALLSAGIGILLAAATIACTPMALTLMNTPSELMSDAILYAGIRLAALPVMFIGNTLSQVFYALGNSKFPFKVNLISMAVNLTLDFTLVLFTPLDVVAVAIGTVAAQLLTCVMYAISLRRLDGVRLERQHWIPNLHSARALLKIGVPLAFRDFPSAFVALLIQSRINALGMAYIAGVAAAKGLYSVMFALGEAYNGAVGPFISQNYGARQFRRISSGMRFSHLAMLACVCVTIAAVLPFMRRFLSLYIDGADPDAPLAIAVGVKQLRIILMFLPTYYISILYRAALRGFGNGLLPMLSGFLEAAARLACLALLPVAIGGEWTAYLAEVIGWPVMFFLLVFAYRGVYRRLCRRLLCSEQPTTS